MKREKIISLLEKEYKPNNAWKEDFIGLQVTGKDEVNNILVTLDITLETISQAINDEIDMIIAHHPLIFGEKEIVVKENIMLKSKLSLIEKANINVFIIHTNIDFGINSLAFSQGEKLMLSEMKTIDNNEAIIGKWEEKFETSVALIEEIKERLKINYQLRTNIIGNKTFTNIVIGSGAAGEIIYDPSLQDSLFLIGELKWHQWVYANEMNINVLELGHFSENIFKEKTRNFLNNLIPEIKVLEGIEENGYSSI